MHVPTSPRLPRKKAACPVPSVPFQVERQVDDDTWQALITWDMKSHVVGGFSSRGPDLLSSLRILTGSVPASLVIVLDDIHVPLIMEPAK